MQSYIEKFNDLFKGKQSIDIQFFSEDPLSIKYVRYNQSGEVCRCPEGSNVATQKAKNGWQQIQCDIFKCQYRQKNEYGKSACNRVGWLKFLIPSISTDRIFLMKITGQTSIDQLNDYITLQKLQGKSIKGNYTLFLQQKEQSNNLGQTFNNYILDILEKDNFNSSKPISNPIKNQHELSTNNEQNVNNKVENQTVSMQNTATQNVPKDSTKTQKNNTTLEKESKETPAKKQSKSKSKKTEESQINKQVEITTDDKQDNAKQEENNNYDNCYILLKTFKETLSKKGVPTEYLIGEFSDMNDKISNIAIKQDYENELLECDLGTLVRLEIAEVGDRKFATKLEFVEKRIKKVAA